MHGKTRLLLTRPLTASRAFARLFGDQFEVHISPVMQLTPLETSGGAGRGPIVAGALIFSSQAGVEVAAEQGIGRDRDTICVGDATAALAREHGYAAVSASGGVDDVFDYCLSNRELAPFWHLRGEHTTGNLVGRLIGAGIEAHERVIYAQHALPLDEVAQRWLRGSSELIVPLFSSRSGILALRDVPFNEAIHIVCMSEAVADALPQIWRSRCIIAPKPSANSMRDAIVTCHARLDC